MLSRPSSGPAGHNHVIAVSLIIVTEIMLFCGLIAAYIILRSQAMAWPPAGQPRLPLLLTAVSSSLLMASGWRALQLRSAVERGEGAAVVRLLHQTMLLGGVFLLLQGFEWASLIGFGLSSVSSVYGATFYTIIGCHALHVIAGVVALGGVLGSTRRLVTASPAQMIPAAQVGPLLGARLFWLFVVAVWPPLYALVYLW